MSRHQNIGRPVARTVFVGLCLVALQVMRPLANSPSQQSQDKNASPQLVPTTLTGKLPSFAPAQETQSLQQRGGLSISVAPSEYTLSVRTTILQHQVSEGFRERLSHNMLAKDGANDVLVERTTVPALVLAPERLIFKVHINNQMPRVFRGAGIVVQFNVAGKLAAVDPSGYADLVNAVIPPRGEQEVTVLGPSMSAIPDASLVALLFYDVVTNQDTAGNITEKQNFEWYFQHGLRIKEETVNVPARQRVWVTPR